MAKRDYLLTVQGYCKVKFDGKGTVLRATLTCYNETEAISIGEYWTRDGVVVSIALATSPTKKRVRSINGAPFEQEDV